MKKHWKVVGVAALVALLGLAVVGTAVFAQEPDDGSGAGLDFHERFRQTLAGILGISVEEYDSAVEQAQGQVLDEAVAEGWLTQDQADRMREHMGRAPGIGPRGMIDRGLGGHGRGMGRWGTNLVSVAADVLGMTQDDLLAELQGGKSIADVANERGVDPQAIADAYLAQFSVDLNQAVEEGRITQKQADWMLEQAETQVTDQLDSTWAAFGPRGFPGGHERGPCPDSSTQPDSPTEDDS